MLAYIKNGKPRRTSGRIYRHEGITYDLRAITKAWSEDELFNIGLYRVQRDDTHTEWSITTGRELVFVNNKVIDRPIHGPIPSEHIKEMFGKAVQDYIDTTAQSRGYDNGFALAGYINSSVPSWKEEAETFIYWRDQVWLYVFEKLEQIKAGKISIPENSEVLIEWLPKIEWPPNIE